MSGWGYQDNLIAKYHVDMGHEVAVIANKYVYDREGNYTDTDMDTETDVNGVSIYRLKQKGNKKVTGPAARVHYEGLYEVLKKLSPDVIFLHNPQILDAGEIAKYMKNALKQNEGNAKKVKLFVDSHSDYSNSGRNFLSKYILHGIIWRQEVKKLVPYTSKFYGVLPARVDFLLERYHTPKNKTELLVMGMDDDQAIKASNPDKIKELRTNFGIKSDDFFIVTGGKIDSSKKQTLLLMDAVHNINNRLKSEGTAKRVRLLIFGSVTDELKTSFLDKCDYKESYDIDKDNAEIVYIGWLKADETYPYFAAADMAIFPGRHSVMWEQVAGQGIPMAVKYWSGTTHVDVGGNCRFIKEDTVNAIMDVIDDLMDKGIEYQKMKAAAQTKASEVFSYRRIAKRCIEI